MGTQATLRQTPGGFLFRPMLVMTAAALMAAVNVRAVHAQATALATSPPRIVTGVVRDSLAGRPLAGALVQLVSSDTLARFGRTETADSLGRFAFTSVPDGSYTIGFIHPALDSLGIEPPLRAVRVRDQRPVDADLAIPSAARMRLAICGAPSPGNTGAVFTGIVRDAMTREPLAGATVSVQWYELTFGTTGMGRRIPRQTVTTNESGGFALCNVPAPGVLAAMAVRGGTKRDSTDVVEVQMPESGFMHRELFVGSANLVALVDSANPSGARRLTTGSGRVSGTVVAAVGGRPLAGASVGIVNGPVVRANERGEWTIANAPTGTRTLEVRALGHYPQRTPVDIAGDVAPMRVSLVTLKSVLDTVQVSASRLTDKNLRDFHERRRSGAGRYLTAEDITRRNLYNAVDLFRTLPGLYIDSYNVDERVLMRNATGERCEPAIYLDGALLLAIGASEIGTFVSVPDIAGVEIYMSSAAIPPQFQQGLQDCGSIVFWTKPFGIPPKPKK